MSGYLAVKAFADPVDLERRVYFYIVAYEKSNTLENIVYELWNR